VGHLTIRATVYKNDCWQDLAGVVQKDPALSRGGVLAHDYMKAQEANPAMAAALQRIRARVGASAAGLPGAGLAALRLKAGLSQAQLAQRLQTQQPSVARWERNPEQMTLPTIRQMAAALGVKEQAIFDVLANFVQEQRTPQSLEVHHAPA